MNLKYGPTTGVGGECIGAGALNMSGDYCCEFWSHVPEDCSRGALIVHTKLDTYIFIMYVSDVCLIKIEFK